MTAWKPNFTGTAAAAGAALLLCASAAYADVKAGVDAWSAGDYAKAVAEWRGPAAKGDADAMFNLAQAYRLGRGVPKDVKQAEALYARAAARGHIKAADNYGLLLFQDGRRKEALPYVSAAAERGDPRAQYLLGIAYFNGDLVAKDWSRAYALLTLANGARLPQAGPAIAQMDDFIPLEQRQQAQVLATKMRSAADAQRTAQMAAADLDGDADNAVSEDLPVRTAVPRPVRQVPVAPSASSAQSAVAAATRANGTESPATAGADFARPRVATPTKAAVAAPAPTPKAATGPWKLQLGAFSVAGNADRAWAQVAGTAALSGKSKQVSSSGSLTRLFAAGWPDQASAQSACAALKSGGHTCLVTR